MSSIRKTIVGHIDMSKVIAVRGPFVAGIGTNEVWFEIDVQLRDEPIRYFHMVDFSTEVGWIDGHFRFISNVPDVPYRHGDDVLTTIVGQNLQKKIDEFVAEWTTWKDR